MSNMAFSVMENFSLVHALGRVAASNKSPRRLNSWKSSCRKDSSQAAASRGWANPGIQSALLIVTRITQVCQPHPGREACDA